MKYIDADRLKAEIERLYDIARDASYNGEIEGEMTAYDKILSIITSLQQEQPETDMKSPFTDGKVAILSRQEEVTFRGEKVKILWKYYRCEDTGREFTNDKLDDDMMWAVFRAYCEKKGMTSFTDIILKQEQQYIRKDALLEWAKEKEQNAITNIVKITYRTVIDKIESL